MGGRGAAIANPMLPRIQPEGRSYRLQSEENAVMHSSSGDALRDAYFAAPAPPARRTSSPARRDSFKIRSRALFTFAPESDSSSSSSLPDAASSEPLSDDAESTNMGLSRRT